MGGVLRGADAGEWSGWASVGSVGTIGERAGRLSEVVRVARELGAFMAEAPPSRLSALLGATDRFHDPHYSGEWEQPGVEAEFGAVLDLLMRGLRARG
ncbi:hypothetical protein [Streptomyces sp. NPDC055013]